MDSYRLEPEEIQTAVAGEVGLAWGVYLEQLQERGHPLEQARVRFSKVLTRGPHGWQVLLYHRDIQPFTADGRYLTVTDSGIVHLRSGWDESA